MVKNWRRRMGVIMLVSMTATTVMLALQNRVAEAIPLHLCSVSAILAAVLAFVPVSAIVDYLWMLGMPGALLALMFPAPAVSRWQPLFSACYLLTHAMIVLIALSALAMGERPRAGKAPQMLMLLQALGLTAFFVNRALGTDFLFLASPPPGTPLEGIYRAGYGVYIAFLQSGMLLLCLIMDRAGRWLFDRSTRLFFCYTNFAGCGIIGKRIRREIRFHARKEGIHIGKRTYFFAPPQKPMGFDGAEYCFVSAAFAAAGDFCVSAAGDDACADCIAAASGLCRSGERGHLHGGSHHAEHDAFRLLGHGALCAAACSGIDGFGLHGGA